MLHAIVFSQHPERAVLRQRCLGVLAECVILTERNTL